jgi:hypothetical protein
MNMPKMPPGMPLIGQGAPQDTPQQPPSKEALNPLPPGPQAMKTLRASSDCPITKEAEAFKTIIPKIQTMKVDVSELLETYGQGVATIIGADYHCTQNTHSRTVVTFSEDPTLEQLNTDLQGAIMEMQEKMGELTALKQRIETLAKARWETAVKNTGLNPEQRFYQIDEEAGTIKQLDLKCNECKGATRIRKLRQKMLDQMVSLEFRQKEEEKNDGLRKDGDGAGEQVEDAGEGGKTNTQE